MNTRKIEIYLYSTLFFLALILFTAYFGARAQILLHAYKNGNAAIIPAMIKVGHRSCGYDFSVDGENYSSSLNDMNRTDIYVDSMDIIYLKDHPWYNMPACDLITDCAKCMPHSEDNNKELMRKEGVRIKVKPYIDEDKHDYAYKFSFGSCTYHGTLDHFYMNPNPEYIKDSVDIVFWPKNPNLNYGSYLLYDK